MLFVCTALVYAASAARNRVSLDVQTAYLAAWRLAKAGTPVLDGLNLPILTHPLRDVWITTDASGHAVVGRSPGVVLAGLPAYAVTRLNHVTLWPGAMTAAVLTALTVTLLFGTLRRRMPTREALLASLVFGFATPVWSVSANGLWPHTITVLGVIGMAWAAERERWWLVGLFGGVTLWGRLHAAFIVAVLGLGIGLTRRRPDIVVKVGAVSGAALVLICAWDRWIYGTWSPTASYDVSDFNDYAAAHVIDLKNQLGMWVSPDRGILIWTPVLVLLLPALARSWKELPDFARWLVLGGLCYTVIQAVMNRFSGGDTFYGYRIGLEMLASATPAFALSARRMGRLARRLLPYVLALQFVAIMCGSVVDRFFISADDVWHKNAFAEVVRSGFPVTVVGLALAMFISVLGERIWTGDGATAPAGGRSRRPFGRRTAPGSGATR